MQTTHIIPALALLNEPTRTITLGRNRLSTIENWSKPAGKAKNRDRNGHERVADRAMPLPVSSYVRTTTLAASRTDHRDLLQNRDART